MHFQTTRKAIPLSIIRQWNSFIHHLTMSTTAFLSLQFSYDLKALTILY